MLLDAGGTFWTKHFVVMVCFPRDLTDAVVCCTQPKRASQIETKGALHMSMVQMTFHSNRVSDHREMQHKSSNRQIRGWNHKNFL